MTLSLEADIIRFLVGSPAIATDPMTPFDDSCCEFLNDLSLSLLKSPNASAFPDVITYAFWCRKANIQKLKAEYCERVCRLGVGLVFHITPANVPVNFAYSFTFGLLAGNANIVKVPSKGFPQVDLICDCINQVLSKLKYSHLKERNAFIVYPQNDEVTSYISSNSNGRLIWGGDETIANVLKFPLQKKGVSLTFGDRYSICILGTASILKCPHPDFQRLVERFFNDTYVMDQNACSSPSFVIWFGKDHVAEAQERFWGELSKFIAPRYFLKAVQAVDKLTHFCQDASRLENARFHRPNPLLYRIELGNLSEELQSLRGALGYFYEYFTDDLNRIRPLISPKCQTVTYFGVEKLEILDFVLSNSLGGIDRIVPVGSALNIGLIWDGYDVVRSLSRIIEVA